MYRSAAFAVEEQSAIFDLIDGVPLAVLTSHGPDGLRASHLPLLLDRSRGAHGTLIGHLARANAQWRDLAHAADTGSEVLAVFVGPDAYVSPSAYVTKRNEPRVVPTWNYVAAQAHGTVRVTHDPAALRLIVERLTDHHELRRADERTTPVERWRVSDAPDDHIDKLCKAIVGIEIEITRLDASRKLSQNKPAEDQRSVAADLAEGTAADRAVAAHMSRSTQ